MGELLEFFKKRKNLINVLILGILILGLYLGIGLAKREQIIKSRASEYPVVFTGDNVTQKDGKWVAKSPKVTLKLTSPLGPAGSAVSSSLTRVIVNLQVANNNE